MQFTKRIQDLPANRNGSRQLEPHHLDDNFAAQDDALLTGFSALFATGGVAVAGTVTLTALSLRVQGRIGVTLDGRVPLHVDDQTLDLTPLAAGKGMVIMTTDPVTIQRPYTDVVTGETLTDSMNVSAGRLSVIGAGQQGVTLDSGGYPVAPSNTVPVAQVTRTAGGATLDSIPNPVLTVRASVAGTPGVDGRSVTGASIVGGHLILHMSSGPDIDAGALPGGSGGSGLPAGGTVGQFLVKTGSADGAAGWATPAAGGGGTGSGTLTSSVPTVFTAFQPYTLTTDAPAGAASTTFPDEGGVTLTNGALPSAAYTDGAWAGFRFGTVHSGLSATFTAAPATGYRLSQARAYMLHDPANGIRVPASMDLQGLVSGVWTQLGTLIPGAVSGWQTVTVDADKLNLLSAQMRLIFHQATNAEWLFLGEVEAQGRVVLAYNFD